MEKIRWKLHKLEKEMGNDKRIITAEKWKLDNRM